MHEDRVIGPPGTGKTTFLAEALGFHAQQRGSNAVIAVSHTRAAAAELAGRHTPIPRDNIGTLHSFALRAIGRQPLVDAKAFGEEHPQWTMTENLDPEDRAFCQGDKVLGEYDRQRNLCSNPATWPPDVVAFASAWESFKQDTGSIDFCDMIEIAANETDCAPQEPEVMVVDELQDTSRLQWKLLHRWGAACEKVITAGDSDQAIFVWSGACPEYFLEHRPERQRVLEQSYRIPRAVHRLAMPWIEQITDREPITYLPRDAEGSVQRTHATTTAPDCLLPLIEEKLGEGKTVMVMASCGYMLQPLLAILRREAIPFANPWRTKQGAWNPLADRGESSTVAAIKAFLVPHTANRWWSAVEARRWVSVTKGLLSHGGKKTLETYLPDNAEPEDVLATLEGCFADPEKFARCLLDPPDCLDMLEAHLLKAKEGAAEYPIRVVRKHGPGRLEEAPRLFIGSCHSFKGAEADVVVVFPDISFQGYTQWAGGDRDSVVRLFYVAMTRAREELHLCAASSGLAVWA